jgi:glutamate synthase (NADH)
LDEMETLKNHTFTRSDGKTAFETHIIDTTFPVGSGPDGMLQVSWQWSG